MDAELHHVENADDHVSLTDLALDIEAFAVPGDVVPGDGPGDEPIPDLLTPRRDAGQPTADEPPSHEGADHIVREEALAPLAIDEVDRVTGFEATVAAGAPTVGEEYAWRTPAGTDFRVLIERLDDRERRGHRWTVAVGTLEPV